MQLSPTEVFISGASSEDVSNSSSCGTSGLHWVGNSKVFSDLTCMSHSFTIQMKSGNTKEVPTLNHLFHNYYHRLDLLSKLSRNEYLC